MHRKSIQKLLWITCMLLFCWGCGDNPREFPGAPISALQTLAVDLAQLGWISDTARVRQVAAYAALNPKNIRYFNQQPFYTIALEDSEIYRSEGWPALDHQLFGQVRSIWAYFYRQKESTEWIVDGVIEQWEFKNEAQAAKAMQQLVPLGDLVYFNTTPFFCSMQQYLIIFHTRANGFSDAQKPIFERFVQENRADTGTL
jgi:hypothetical protein